MNPRTRRGLAGRLVALALAATLSACGYSEAAMQAQRSRLQALEQTAAQQRTERAELEHRLRDVEARSRALDEVLRELGGNMNALNAERRELASSVETLESERGALRDSLRDARQALDEMRAREAQSRERAQVFRTMLERFRSMISAGQLRVRVTRNRMVVELPEGVLFDTGRAEIKPTGQRVLEQVSEVLRTMDRDFQVAGHTDNVPIHNARFASNWELSAGRALTVSHFLLGHGMSAERLSAAGYADTHPVASNDTPEGRQQNRRIEIVLVPRLDELPDLSPLQELTQSNGH